MSIRNIRTCLLGAITFGAALAASASPAAAALIGFLQTPTSSGVVGGGNWEPPAGGSGYRVTWDISQNPDNTWHYAYTFTQQDGGSLAPLTSHVIFQLSETAGEDDLFNYTGDIDKVEHGTFGLSSGNPGFPAGEVIFGIKINLAFNQELVEFDSTRAPMWGDFYSKAGGSMNPSFAYNVDLGTDVANPHDIFGTPVDADGNDLAKILVPNTLIPEPAPIALLLISATLLLHRTGRRS